MSLCTTFRVRVCQPSMLTACCLAGMQSTLSTQLTAHYPLPFFAAAGRPCCWRHVQGVRADALCAQVAGGQADSLRAVPRLLDHLPAPDRFLTLALMAVVGDRRGESMYVGFDVGQA